MALTAASLKAAIMAAAELAGTHDTLIRIGDHAQQGGVVPPENYVRGTMWENDDWLYTMLEGMALDVAANIPIVPPTYRGPIHMSSANTIIPAGGGTYALGQLYFNPLWVPSDRSISFNAEARVSNIAQTGTIRLWNTSTNEYVGTALEFTGSLDVQHDAVALVMGIGAGQLRSDLPFIYEFHASVTGADPVYFSISNVYFEVY